MIIVTQFKKIGALVLVNRDEVKSSSSDPVFHTRSLLGNDSDDIHVFARHLYEHLRINKPAVFGISLKDYSVKTLTLLKEVLLEHSLCIFGQIVIGPPGSGKTTYCHEMSQFLQQIGRKVAVVNIDPANDGMMYTPAIDIANLITLEEVMVNYHLGPNGGLVYCMEFLEKNMDWLFEKINHFKGHYFIFDCPGQVELYTHHNSVKNITEKLVGFGMHLCAINLIDSHYCSDPGKFISTLLMSLTTMLNIALPHVNVLSKTDLTERYGKLLFHPSFYTEVLDLDYLLDALNEDPFAHKRGLKLNKALVELIEGYNLVSFIPLCIKNKELISRVHAAVDTANGYIFGSGEERNVNALLSSAVGVHFAGGRDTGFEEMSTDP
ncbi:hypothetical protein J437_LFUL000688 [Ladona fulva]|uniref:GPN-loop GTPase 2 n=1 Tax=Ladona fulva TaxID=123851 RepID=A0A8K0K427_LADFU|nr:hypothetical protein J437_LFUL000688 [Ladona fulva]